MGGLESIDHLLVQCPYSSYILRILASMVSPNISTSFPSLLDLLSAWGTNPNSLHKHILLLMAQVFCYQLWRERNARRHGKGIVGPYLVLDGIITDY